jgi:hypothetical protein
VSEVSKARTYIPLTAAAAAVAKVYDDTSALVASIPRTLRTLTWAVRAGFSYKQLLVSVDPYDTEEYNRNMSRLHDIWGKVSSNTYRLVAAREHVPATLKGGAAGKAAATGAAQQQQQQERYLQTASANAEGATSMKVRG